MMLIFLFQALSTVKKQHEEELSTLRERSEQEKQQHSLSMQASLTAEKQVTFNEALNKAVAVKEKTIEELKVANARLKDQLQRHQGTGHIMFCSSKILDY